MGGAAVTVPDAREVLTDLLGRAECVHCGEAIRWSEASDAWVHGIGWVFCGDGKTATVATPKPLDPSQVLQALGASGMLVKKDCAECDGEGLFITNFEPPFKCRDCTTCSGHGFTWAQPATQ